MPATSLNRVAEALDLAQRHFEQGRLVAAMGLLQSISRPGLSMPLLAGVEHLHCVTAFRLGQLDESLACARSFLQHVDNGIDSTLERRFSILAVAVVAAGELALYEECLEHLAELLSLASRLGGLAHYVRARGTAASAFMLLGDLWAAQRILAVLTSEFDRPHSEQRLETTMRCNHAALCLQLARMAQAAGDDDATQLSLQSAKASVTRATQTAAGLQDRRIVTYVRLHEAELGMLLGDIEQAQACLADALKEAQGAGLNAHWRHLQLLQAETLLLRGEPQQALDILAELRQSERPNNELSSRLHQRELAYRALSALGQAPAALEAFEDYHKLQAYRSFRQARAQSALMRSRLEMEHLFQRSSESKAFGAGPIPRNQDGSATPPADTATAPRGSRRRAARPASPRHRPRP